MATLLVCGMAKYPAGNYTGGGGPFDDGWVRVSNGVVVGGSGRAGLPFMSSWGFGAYAYYPLGVNAPTLTHGFRTVVGTPNTPIAVYRDSGTTQVYLHLNAGSYLEVRNNAGTVLATATFPWSLGALNFVEWKVRFHATLGTIDVRVNGTDVPGLTGLTGLNTLTTANAWANEVALVSQGPGWQDIVVNDATGSVNTGFTGDVGIVTRFPNGTVAGSGGTIGGTSPAATKHGSINQTTRDDDVTTLDFAGVDGAYFTMSSLGYTSGTPVQAVRVSALVRKDDAGVNSGRTKVQSGGVDALGTAVGLTAVYGTLQQIVQADPNGGGGLTAGIVDAMHVGYDRTA